MTATVTPNLLARIARLTRILHAKNQLRKSQTNDQFLNAKEELRRAMEVPIEK